jgi:predicted small lipoprotein YifL
MRLRAPLVTSAVACLLALAGCGDRGPVDASTAGGVDSAADASPADTSVATGTSIPDDFALAAGMGGPSDTVATSRSGTGLRDLSLCGTSPLRGLGLRDRMVADNSGGESADTRELVLLGTPDEAQDVARSFTDLPAECDPADGGDGMETLTEVRESPFGAAPAITLVQTYTFDRTPGDGATVLHVVPVGAALLVTSTYGQWTSDGLDEGVASTVEPLRATVDALAIFEDGAEPSSSPEPSTAAEPSAAAELPRVPADFPLDVGMPQADSDTRVSAPSPDGDGLGEVEMCGQVVWPQRETPGGVRRLVASALAPEDYEWRELFVHAGADHAGSAMDVLRQATAECRGSANLVWTVLDRDTGHDTVTVGLTYSDGLGSSVFQVTRVGSARLLVATYGEGSLASLDEQADGVTGTTEEILPAMCVFTRTGC